MAGIDLYKDGPQGSLRISVRVLRIFDELDNNYKDPWGSL